MTQDWSLVSKVHIRWLTHLLLQLQRIQHTHIHACMHARTHILEQHDGTGL